MKKYFKYLKTICVHKYYVFVECCKLGIVWQGIVHDMSKFSSAEFFASSRYYNGDGNDYEYQLAWLHHKSHNKHHWQYWVDWTSSNGKYIITKIPIKYMKEMYADMIGASRAYNKNKFDKSEPYRYFITKCNGWVINPDNKKWLLDKFKEFGRNN